MHHFGDIRVVQQLAQGLPVIDEQGINQPDIIAVAELNQPRLVARMFWCVKTRYLGLPMAVSAIPVPLLPAVGRR